LVRFRLVVADAGWADSFPAVAAAVRAVGAVEDTHEKGGRHGCQKEKIVRITKRVAIMETQEAERRADPRPVCPLSLHWYLRSDGGGSIRWCLCFNH
jgi:hypothetical protein